MILITFAVGLYAAATVAPAAAGTAATGAGCEPTIFDGLNGLESVAASARGDVAREPALNQTVEDLPASAKGKGGKSFRATAPVYFHVVHAGGVGNISQAVIDEQMRVLNAAFAGFYGGAATGISFSLAGVTRTDNAAWHNAGPGTSEEREMKRTLRARSGRPAARSRGSTRSTTTWTTRTTPVTTNSRRARSPECRTPGCITGRSRN